MVIDKIENASLYFGMGPRIEKALLYLSETDFFTMEAGKYQIDGDNIYTLVQKYDSKPLSDGKWEAHRKYIDLQYVVYGEEQMGYANVEKLEVVKEYDKNGDFLLLQGKGSMLLCSAGTFAVFGPSDAHMPGIAIESPKPIIKVVVKVRV